MRRIHQIERTTGRALSYLKLFSQAKHHLACYKPSRRAD